MSTRKSISRRQVSGGLFVESLEERRLLAGDGTLELSRFGSAAELETFLLEDSLKRWDGLFGQPGWGWWGPVGPGGPIFFGPEACPVCDGVVDNAAPPPQRDHSDTNTQVAGVDEDDIVETDGDYLYMLAGQELVIADAWQPSELGVVSRVEIDGLPVGEFLRNDRLTVISNSFGGYGPVFGGPAIDVAFAPIPYETVPPTVNVTVFDVSDRANPKIIQKTKLDGSFVDTRAVGDTAYVITSDQFGLPEPELKCDATEGDGEGKGIAPPNGDIAIFPPFGPQCVYESRDEYIQRVTGKIFEQGLPHYSSTDSSGLVVETGLVSQPTDIYHPVSKDYWNLISVSVFDMAGSEPGSESSTSVPTTYSTTVYGSSDSLYLTNPDWGSGWGGQEATSILKFDMSQDGKKVDLSAVGQVPGRVLNSFSIDEQDHADGNEYLRIATTTGWGTESDNRVHVLKQNGTELTTVGSTKRLAPGEQIFSVRYVGDTGYVVTFRQVDPLFTIDLSVPTDPQVKGDLHIPGFSNYLQPIRDDYLIGLGRNADPNTGRVQELQVSLFDVSDLSIPRLADRFAFDVPGWAWSEAISDHHAVSYFPEQQVLTIPVSNDGWVGIDRNSDGANDIQAWRPRTDLYVFRVELPSDAAPDTKATINFLGTIEDDAAIRRSVRIEQFLYSISDNSVSVHEILNPKAEVGKLHFGQEDVGVPVFAASREADLVRAAIETPEITPPQVVDIMVGSSQWDHDFVNYLDSARAADGSELLSVVPFTAVDQIKVKFSEDVFVGSEDLTVISKNGVQHSFLQFTYEVDTATAVWTLSSPVNADAVTMRLGSIIDVAGNSLDGDANGRAGGRFRSDYSVLPGDVDRDGQVDLADLASAKTHAVSSLGDEAYSLAHDVNGDGQIDNGDFMAIMTSIGSKLPGFVAPIVGDSNRDGVFDSTDLIQVMQGGKYRTDRFAAWNEGDWNRDGVFDESDLVRAFQEGKYQDGAATEVSSVDFAFELLARESDDNGDWLRV